MMKTQWMGAVLAVLLVGCGKEEEATGSESCADVEQAVESIRSGLGSCTPNYKNQEPLTFSRSACDAELETACSTAEERERIDQYVACLKAVAPCTPAQQTAFDDAIDACLDTLQTSGTKEECIEAAVGD
ncbi:hypothetical protein JY651_41135 [Pyxidicoccus parkwayensis]|jgi:hypothetical protein|uniref:Lipoprotein n=1 Tax=Pyxidicoccus parkwayensis TaxID=2813578 RepID=A0ABX7NST3_9BACT|nr:hypothetical protein [Pyxidicoccus parkwaysis]QSQ21523.1 hypothetical protein JY651_41135 [Pyxidicoccus parkwaysis]